MTSPMPPVPPIAHEVVWLCPDRPVEGNTVNERDPDLTEAEQWLRPMKNLDSRTVRALHVLLAEYDRRSDLDQWRDRALSAEARVDGQAWEDLEAENKRLRAELQEAWNAFPSKLSATPGFLDATLAENIRRVSDDRHHFRECFDFTSRHMAAVHEELGLSYEAETPAVIAAIRAAAEASLAYPQEPPPAGGPS